MLFNSLTGECIFDNDMSNENMKVGKWRDIFLTLIYCHLFNRCAEPEADTRKKDALTYMVVLGITAVMTGYYKRFRWSTLKTRSITYVK
jgi:hypothetical protein